MGHAAGLPPAGPLQQELPGDVPAICARGRGYGRGGRTITVGSGRAGVDASTLALIAGGIVAAGAAVGLVQHRRHPSAARQPSEVGIGVSGDPPDSGRGAVEAGPPKP
jgi:hypothetical protein